LTEKFILAAVGAPFGLKGFVRVKSFSGETGHILPLKSVILRLKGKEIMYSVEESAGSDDPGVLFMKFSGIDSPEKAKTLNGAEIIAERSMAAPLNPDEFYIEDLKNLAVISGTEKPEMIGNITDILEGGGGDLAEIKLVSGEKKFVPFRKEFFGEINFEKGSVILLEKWILE